MQQNRKRVGPRKPRIFPLPEAVSGGKPWDVSESQGPRAWADPVHRRMTIPVADDAKDAAVRLHEMAHARWTPANAAAKAAEAGVLHETINAAEDARMHRKLGEAGFRCESVLTDAMVADYANAYESGRVDHYTAACLLMASIGTGDENTFARLMRDNEMAPVEWVVREIWRDAFGGRRPAYGRAIDAALALEEWFRKDPDPDVLDAIGEQLERAEEIFDDGERPAGDATWGAMKVVEPPRVLRLPAKVRRHKRIAAEEGTIPRQWHRMPIDGKVFGRKAKRPAGGAVLIDQSGSMRFTPEQVLEILLACPAAVVATYAGEGLIGELRILALGGKRVADGDVWIAVGNNTVDGPALEWLGRQRGPRFWVSDGMATSPSGDAVTSAARIAMRHRILRVDTMEDLLGQL